MSDDVHVLTLTRFQRGQQTYGQLRGAAGMFYGTRGRCSCGWENRENTAPSAGGRQIVKQRHGLHVAEASA